MTIEQGRVRDREILEGIVDAVGDALGVDTGTGKTFDAAVEAVRAPLTAIRTQRDALADALREIRELVRQKLEAPQSGELFGIEETARAALAQVEKEGAPQG